MAITKNQLLELLYTKISSTKIENVKEDVFRFVRNQNELEMFNNSVNAVKQTNSALNGLI